MRPEPGAVGKPVVSGPNTRSEVIETALLPGFKLDLKRVFR